MGYFSGSVLGYFSKSADTVPDLYPPPVVAVGVIIVGAVVIPAQHREVVHVGLPSA